jgi:hypothetical protein
MKRKISSQVLIEFTRIFGTHRTLLFTLKRGNGSNAFAFAHQLFYRRALAVIGMKK